MHANTGDSIGKFFATLRAHGVRQRTSRVVFRGGMRRGSPGLV
jgi:hypothetical protein